MAARRADKRIARLRSLVGPQKRAREEEAKAAVVAAVVAAAPGLSWNGVNIALASVRPL
jgi:hypothetical protein